MNPDSIQLSSINKLFEYEKQSRDIDNIDDIILLKKLTKSYLKLYLCQQEVLLNFKI